jgi:hypothetical protein
MSSDRPARRSLAAWLVPLATFGLGAVVAFMLIPRPAPEKPTVNVPTFGAAAPSATSPPNSATQAELALYRDINDKFVSQLRRYETRLLAIATAADAEGAPKSAEILRDFALETELLIDRYDLIVKKN